MHIATGCLVSEQHVVTTAICVSEIIKTGGKFFEFATIYHSTNDVSRSGFDYTISMVEAYPCYTPYVPVNARTYNVGCILVGSLISFEQLVF